MGGLPDLDTLGINVLFARAVIEGKVDGQVWTSGFAAHVVHQYGMSLVWGEGVGEAFEEVVERLADGGYRTRDEWLQVDPRWGDLPWAERLAGAGVETHTRVNFAFERERFHPVPVSDGWAVVRADASDFARPGGVVPAEFWRDAEQFLAEGGGWRIESDGVRGALAFTSFRSEHELELGIETAPEARGRGLAAAAVSRMVVDVLEQGLVPVWACREGNVASYRLAERIGFRATRRLPYYRLPVRVP